MTGSIFHKLMLIGINSILQLFINILYQMFPYFNKDQCLTNRPIITWVVAFTIFKYCHNISFLLVSIKCLLFFICISIYLNIYLPSQWSDTLTDNAKSEIHIKNDSMRSKEWDVLNEVSSLPTQLHPLSQSFFLSTPEKGWKKSSDPCKVARQ